MLLSESKKKYIDISMFSVSFVFLFCFKNAFWKTKHLGLSVTTSASLISVSVLTIKYDNFEAQISLTLLRLGYLKVVLFVGVNLIPPPLYFKKN